MFLAAYLKKVIIREIQQTCKILNREKLAFENKEIGIILSQFSYLRYNAGYIYVYVRLYIFFYLLNIL